MNASMPGPNGKASEFMQALQAQKGWLTVQAVVLIVLGALSILLPVISTLTIALLLGAILVVAGLSEGVRAIRSWGHRGAGLGLVLAVVALIAGLIMLFNPFAGALSLTLVLGIYMLAAGFFKAVMAFTLRPLAGWGWLAFSAILAVILGIIVLAGLPSTGLWVPGMLLGIELVFFGAALLALSMGLGRTA